MTSKIRVSIVIPAYNEEKAIKDFLNQLINNIAKKSSFEIIVVDDGSTDKTKLISESYPINVISHQTNRGYGAALKSGISYANGENILICDSDGQHSVEDINKIINQTNYDMVIGERNSTSYQQKNRIVGKTVIRLIANFLVGQKIPDLNSGLRMFKKNVIENYLHLLPDSFSASSTMTLLFIKRKYSIKWIEITTQKRVGESSVRQVKHGLYTILLITRIIMLFNPLKIFFPISLIFFLFGFTWGLYFLSNDGLSIFSAVYLILSVQIILFGLIADQIAMARLENMNLRRNTRSK